MSLEDDVVSVLESAGRVNFMCCGVRVYGEGYRKLARAIRNGHIYVRQNTGLGSEGRPAGLYDHALGPNRQELLQLAYAEVTSLKQRALVIHEMTHALQDFHRQTLRRVDAECSAYIAGAVYAKINAPGQNIYDDARIGRNIDSTLIFAMAQAIAERLIGPPAFYHVSDQEADNLRGYIAAHPVYHHHSEEEIAFDGITPN